MVRFRVPPLRKHAGDIPLLVEHFLKQAGHAGRVDQVVPRAVMKELCLHRWPGNVRELRNLVEASLAMGEPPRLMSSMPPSDPGSDRPHDQRIDLPYKQARATVLQEFELRYLRRLLHRADDNVSKAARLAGMDRSYLIQLLRKHELS